jgi:peroxiredoxin
MEELSNSMERYWKEEARKYEGTFYSDFMNSMITPRPPEIEIPAECKNPDSLRWIKNYVFRKEHYWDNFNFAQNGLLRTPLIEKKLDTYLKKVLIQMPDSILAPTIQLIEKSKANKEMFQYISGNILTNSANSDIMGMDKVFVEVAKSFFLNGQAEWLDSTTIEKIKREVYLSLPNLIGNKAPELKLPNENNEYFSLHQIEAEYTILYFWEPNCNHCAKATPKLYNDIYIPLREKDVEIFAVCTQDNKEEWQNFILDNKLFDWINVWDPEMLSNFRGWYNIKTTPTLFLLDKDKKIVAKKIDVETAGKYLKKLLAN